MTVRSGRKCSALLTKANQLGCLVRTCLESSIWNSTECLLTWRASTTPAGRLLFRLLPVTPNTDEIESGLWPTPSASAARQGQNNPDGKRGQTLIGAARGQLWPTPTKQDGENDDGPSQYNRNSIPLNTLVKMFPTPTASMVTLADMEQARAHSSKRGEYQKDCGSLNPLWVEWLMGYPVGHTESEDSATPLFPNSHSDSSAGC